MILATVVSSLKRTIGNWLALAIFVLVLPVRELEYYAGLMVALGEFTGFKGMPVTPFFLPILANLDCI